MVAPLPNVTTWDKDSASREQNKINQFVFYDEAKRKDSGTNHTELLTDNLIYSLKKTLKAISLKFSSIYLLNISQLPFCLHSLPKPMDSYSFLFLQKHEHHFLSTV